MVKCLEELDRVNLLLPAQSWEQSQEMLGTYWARFRSQYPTHEVFGLLTMEGLQMALPIKLHGDEGRRISAASNGSSQKCTHASCRWFLFTFFGKFDVTEERLFFLKV